MAWGEGVGGEHCHKTVSTDHNFWTESGSGMEPDWKGPSAYYSDFIRNCGSALPARTSSSLLLCSFDFSPLFLPKLIWTWTNILYSLIDTWILMHLKRMCKCSISRISSRISPSWARAGCRKTLCLLHYLRKIKFIHSFIHSFFSAVLLRPQRPYGLSGTGNPGRPPRLSRSSGELWKAGMFGSVKFV